MGGGRTHSLSLSTPPSLPPSLASPCSSSRREGGRSGAPPPVEEGRGASCAKTSPPSLP